MSSWSCSHLQLSPEVEAHREPLKAGAVSSPVLVMVMSGQKRRSSCCPWETTETTRHGTQILCVCWLPFRKPAAMLFSESTEDVLP